MRRRADPALKYRAYTPKIRQRLGVDAPGRRRPPDHTRVHAANRAGPIRRMDAGMVLSVANWFVLVLQDILAGGRSTSHAIMGLLGSRFVGRMRTRYALERGS